MSFVRLLRPSALGTIVALGTVSALSLNATITTYTTQPAFNAAVPGVTTYTFPSVYASPATPTYSIGPLNFQQGVSGSPDGSYYATYNDGLYGPNQTYLELTNTTSNTEVETILLSTPASALAFQIGGDGGTYGVAVNGTPFTTLTVPTGFDTPPGGGTDLFEAALATPSNGPTLPSIFFGITDTSPITSLSLTSNSTDTDILFAEVGPVSSIAPTSPVPEPSTLALLGTGALGIFGAARRRLTRG